MIDKRRTTEEIVLNKRNDRFAFVNFSPLEVYYLCMDYLLNYHYDPLIEHKTNIGFLYEKQYNVKHYKHSLINYWCHKNSFCSDNIDIIGQNNIATYNYIVLNYNKLLEDNKCKSLYDYVDHLGQTMLKTNSILYYLVPDIIFNDSNIVSENSYPTNYINVKDVSYYIHYDHIFKLLKGIKKYPFYRIIVPRNLFVMKNIKHSIIENKDIDRFLNTKYSKIFVDVYMQCLLKIIMNLELKNYLIAGNPEHCFSYYDFITHNKTNSSQIEYSNNTLNELNIKDKSNKDYELYFNSTHKLNKDFSFNNDSLISFLESKIINNIH